MTISLIQYIFKLKEPGIVYVHEDSTKGATKPRNEQTHTTSHHPSVQHKNKHQRVAVHLEADISQTNSEATSRKIKLTPTKWNKVMGTKYNANFSL